MFETPLSIINYWKAIEEFTAGRIEEERSTGNVKSIQKEVLKDEDIPWLNHQYFQHVNTETHVWNYTVFLGIILIKDINREIISRLHDEEQFNNKDKDIEGVSSICSFQVNAHGQIIQNSLKMADWFTAINILGKNEDIKNANYNSKERISNKIKDLMFNLTDKLNSNEQRTKICFKDLKILTENCIELTGWQSLIEKNLVKNSAIIYSNQLKRPFREELKNSDDVLDHDSGITNSYILSDLEYITKEIKDNPNALPLGLTQYLNSQQIQKINLYEDKKSLQKFVSPKYLPIARWPNNGDHSLNLAQQTAVNLSLLDKEGLFSINGPPGTGKSTLLRDIIANIIVDRGKVLSSFENIDNAFVDNEKFKHEAFSYKVWELDAKLYGYEIFITSSNNAAVENISKEIPKLDSIDSKWNIDYFADIASFVHDEPCWGLGAAPLGNKKNRINYFNKFWSSKAQTENNSYTMGLEEYLKSNQPPITWASAREDFLITYDACSKLKDDLIELENIILTLPDLKIEKAIIDKHKVESVAKIKALQNQIELISKNIDELDVNMNHLKWSMEGKILLKPSWYKRIWGMIFGSHHLNKWQDEISSILNETETSRKQSITFNEQKNKLIKQCDNESEALKNYITSSEELALTINTYNSLIAEYEGQIGKHFPDDRLWELPKDQLHQILPWNYEKLHKLRGELFIKALKLHQAFIMNTSEKLMNNLRVMNLLMRSNNLPSEYDYLLKSVWASFFIVVPVVSSTFSSFANLCGGLGKGSIGWILIDEAGQASPQAAVGTFWRAKRIIVVGDPMQIKPIVSISNELDDSFRKFYGVSKQWSPLNESLQTISDRNNIYGAYTNNKENWIGCPLIVHRRCAEPMFSIANKIAYDNLMIYATTPTRTSLTKNFKSSWINVESAMFKNHWSDAEGQAVITLITKILGQTNDLPLIYIISPFKEVASQMRKKLSQNTRTWDLKQRTNSEIRSWINNSVGTIHTFQGKEAEVVIVLLGGNPNRYGGIDWASKEPNMLNVALTRAKNLVFVIGNYAIWSKLPYFQELGYALPKIEYYAEELEDAFA